METVMRIGELGQATGVDIETIRYYEKAGLLPNPARSGNGYRAYGRAHLERLAFIRHCRRSIYRWRTSNACWSSWRGQMPTAATSTG